MADTATPAPEKPAEKVREVPKELTIKDDKRAQYARLVIANYIRSNPKVVGKKAADVKDVNEISNEDILKAGTAMLSGNLLDGTGGLEVIQEYSANGSTTGRALTTSYASEVRPFLRKLIVSDKFARRGGLSDEEKAEREKKREDEKAAKAKERAEAKEKRDKERAEAKAKADAAAKEKAEKEAKKKEAAAASK